MKINTLKYPMVIAHRGFKSRYPENTMTAFEAAVKAGVAMIELDIHISADDELIVIHDATLDRTTNGTGDVISHSVEQIKGLDSGSWFDAPFKTESVPLLEEVLSQFGEKVVINIEVKGTSELTPQKSKVFVHRLLQLIQKYQVADSVIISSFEWPILESIHQKNNQLKIGVLSEAIAFKEVKDFCQSVSAYSWHSDYESLTQEQIRVAKKAGYIVVAYTVNDPEIARQLFNIGLDGVFSDNAELMN